MAAENTATFAIQLDASQLKSEAGSGGAALEQLKVKIQSDETALAGLQRAFRNMKAGGTVSKTALADVDAQIKALKANIGTATDRFRVGGGNLQLLGKKAGDAAQGARVVADSVKSAGGPMGEMVAKAGSVAQMLGKGGFAGACAVAAAAVVALGAALVVAVVSLAKFGVAQADAARNSQLMLEGVVKMPSWFGIASGSADGLRASIDRVSAGAAISKQQVTDYATQLYQMGMRGKNLTVTLEAMSAAAGAGQTRWLGAIADMGAGAAMMGGNVEKVAQVWKNRFGPIASKVALGLDVQMMKLKESIGGLFRNLKIEGFLSALHEVLSLFSSTTATGQALKVLLEALINPLVAGVEKAGPIVKRFFQGMTIGLLQFAIVVLTARNWLLDTFGRPDLFKGMDWGALAVKAGTVAAWGLVGAVVALVTVLGLLAAIVVVALAPFAAMLTVTVVSVAALVAAVVAFGVAVVVAFGKAWDFIKGLSWEQVGYWITRGILFPFVQLPGLMLDYMAKIGEVIWKLGALIVKWFRAIDWSALGKAILDGLIAGLVAGAGLLWDALKGLATGAFRAFKAALGIKSPSRVFMGAGLQIGGGVVAGLHEMREPVSRAAADLVRLPDLAGGELDQGGGAGGAPAAARPAFSVTIGSIEIHAGEPTAKGIAEEIKRELERIVEGVAIQIGALPHAS